MRSADGLNLVTAAVLAVEQLDYAEMKILFFNDINAANCYCCYTWKWLKIVTITSAKDSCQIISSLNLENKIIIN